eukprot:PhM_4_TR17869/c0_g1_i3/m.61711
MLRFTQRIFSGLATPPPTFRGQPRRALVGKAAAWANRNDNSQPTPQSPPVSTPLTQQHGRGGRVAITSILSQINANIQFASSSSSSSSTSLTSDSKVVSLLSSIEPSDVKTLKHAVALADVITRTQQHQSHHHNQQQQHLGIFDRLITEVVLPRVLAEREAVTLDQARTLWLCFLSCGGGGGGGGVFKQHPGVLEDVIIPIVNAQLGVLMGQTSSSTSSSPSILVVGVSLSSVCNLLIESKCFLEKETTTALRSLLVYVSQLAAVYNKVLPLSAITSAVYALHIFAPPNIQTQTVLISNILVRISLELSNPSSSSLLLLRDIARAMCVCQHGPPIDPAAPLPDQLIAAALCHELADLVPRRMRDDHDDHSLFFSVLSFCCWTRARSCVGKTTTATTINKKSSSSSSSSSSSASLDLFERCVVAYFAVARHNNNNNNKTFEDVVYPIEQFLVYSKKQSCLVNMNDKDDDIDFFSVLRKVISAHLMKCLQTEQQQQQQQFIQSLVAWAGAAHRRESETSLDIAVVGAALDVVDHLLDASEGTGQFFFDCDVA